MSAEQQAIEIAQLKQIIKEQKLEIATIKSECRDRLTAIQTEALLKQKEAEIEHKNSEIAKLNQQLQECDREINHLKCELNNGLHELRLKYKRLITQFILSRSEKQQIDRQNKSLQACKNIFIKAQRKINLLQCENQLLQQKNIELQSKVKLLRI